MSGYSSSKRQQMSGRVRAFLAVLLALSMMVIMSVSLFAQDAPAEPTAVPAEEAAAVAAPVEAAAPSPVQPYGQICVDGSVINFDETLLPDQLDDAETPWTITAVALGPDGQPGTATQKQTDEDGYFYFDPEDFAGPGLVEFSIAIPDGSGWEPITPDRFTIDLKYQEKCQVIRFKLRRPVQVDVLKINDNHEPLEGWIIKAAPVYGNWFASTVITETAENGVATFYLTEGKWTFTEQAPKGTTYTAVMPSSGKQELNVKWNGGEPLQIRFKNRVALHGCVDAYKYDAPPTANEANATFGYGLPGWKMTLKRLDGSTVATLATDANGKATFKNLPFGTYILQEESRVGWAADPTAGGTSRYVTVSADQGSDADQCVAVEFYNVQNAEFCIEGRKVDTNGLVGLPGWLITITPNAKGGFPNSAVEGYSKIEVTTDGTGTYRYVFPKDDYRIPGAAYKVCEEERDGWLPHTPLCQTVYLPKTPGACVKAWDFENQQVGHWESVVYGKPASSSGSGCAYTHTVQPGESLYGIGAAYGVSASAMLSANPWVYSRPHYYVYPGDSVCIP
jgi:hypothetical protein